MCFAIYNINLYSNVTICNNLSQLMYFLSIDFFVNYLFPKSSHVSCIDLIYPIIIQSLWIRIDLYEMISNWINSPMEHGLLVWLKQNDNYYITQILSYKTPFVKLLLLVSILDCLSLSTNNLMTAWRPASHVQNLITNHTWTSTQICMSAWLQTTKWFTQSRYFVNRFVFIEPIRNEKKLP